MNPPVFRILRLNNFSLHLAPVPVLLLELPILRLLRPVAVLLAPPLAPPPLAPPPLPAPPPYAPFLASTSASEAGNTVPLHFKNPMVAIK